MRPQVILVTLAALAVLADVPLGQGNKEEAGAAVVAVGSWPCCDDCGMCTRMIPPTCRCNDISPHGCRPECKKCVRYTLTADDDDDGIQMPATSAAGRPRPVRTYRCADMLTNFCKRRCTPAPAAAFLGEAF